MSDNAAPAAPATGQPSPLPASAPAVSTALENTVGTRGLSGNERQALLDRLERNGTKLEEVNAIAAKNGILPFEEDPRTDAERALDARGAPNETADGYLPSLNLREAFDASAAPAAIAEVEHHAAAFAHSLGLPKNTAGETMRRLTREAVRVNGLSPEHKAAHVAKSQAILVRALGGPAQLQEAIKTVSAYVEKAGNSDFAKHVDAGLTDPQSFLTIYHAAQRQAFRASRQR